LLTEEKLREELEREREEGSLQSNDAWNVSAQFVADSLPILLPEMTCPAKEKAVVEREELQADDARAGQSCLIEIFHAGVPWPRRVDARRDHREDTVS
jgi:hypothetical protein